MDLLNSNKSDHKSIMKLQVIVAGLTNCGKTSVLRRFRSQVFNELVEMTIGASLCRTKIQIGLENVEFELWVGFFFKVDEQF